MNTELYLDPDLPQAGSFELKPEESRHLVRVRREREGVEVLVTNGRGLLARCILQKALPTGAVLEIQTLHEEPAPLPLELAVSPLHTPTPICSINALNFSRFSAVSMASISTPIMRTP